MKSVRSTSVRNRSLNLARIISVLAGLWFAPLTASPAAGEELGTKPPLQFETEIVPLLRAHCLRCHGGNKPKAELDVSHLAGLLKGGDSGPAVVPGQPAESPLYERIHNGTMPPEPGRKLAARDVEIIRRWILAGAAGGRASPPAASPSAAAALSQLDALPILMRRCAACHGASRREAHLDVRSKAALLRGGKSGPAIIPGRSAESRLLQRIHAGEMPPPKRLVEASVKPIEASEVATLTQWIADGAREVADPPDIAGNWPDALVSAKDRQFWAFQPPQLPAIPVVQAQARVRNPVDAFVLSRLEARGLSLSPEAAKETLLRRATFDLTGLPPEPEAIRAFLADSSSDAYEKQIDRLLASPRYGERWGRYWLDVAGYADSEGKREQDIPRPNAWRYRDYVVRAFNADKPYDRFLLEQIAGDELADYESARVISPELYDNLVATGFLRMAPDGTWANITGYLSDRIDVVSDELDVLTSGVLGLTMKCARCHNHKFDPLPQRDYYRLVDVFKGAFDEFDWLKPSLNNTAGLCQGTQQERNLTFLSEQARSEVQQHNAPLNAGIERLNKEIHNLSKCRAARFFEERLIAIPAPIRSDVRAAFSTSTDQRTEIQKYLFEKFSSELRPDRNTLKTLDPDFRSKLDAFDRELRQLQDQLQDPTIRALWDRGRPSPTYVYRRGDPFNPGRRVGPGVPSVLTNGRTPFVVQPPWPGASKTGRRLAFARWLVQPDHPLTARVFVNRVWSRHFGAGLVRTVGNFGRSGSPPTHPELLDWLARELIRNRWSLKSLHRLLMTSSTYRQVSVVPPLAAQRDPDNRLLSRMPLVRLDAEALYDALLLIAGKLDATPGGPPDRVTVRADGLVTPISGKQGWRRLIYVQQARKRIPTHLECFDYPQMNPNCLERRDSIVATQALYLMNDGMVHELASHFARRVAGEVGNSAPADPRIERAFLIALGRSPLAAERQAARDLFAEYSSLPAAARSPRELAETPGEQAGLIAFCRALINSAGFLFVD